MAASLAALLLLPPITQDQSYHRFADPRAFFGMPNFWNVVSNLPFIAVGVVGLRQFHRDPATLVIFLGIFLTGFGSSYYHWNPSDRTLFWDRLPMTLCFMAILRRRRGARERTVGSRSLWPLLATGLLSPLLWRFTGDLRLGAGFTLSLPGTASAAFAVPAQKYRHLLLAHRRVLYALVKLFEFADHAVHSSFSCYTPSSISSETVPVSRQRDISRCASQLRHRRSWLHQ